MKKHIYILLALILTFISCKNFYGTYTITPQRLKEQLQKIDTNKSGYVKNDLIMPAVANGVASGAVSGAMKGVLEKRSEYFNAIETLKVVNQKGIEVDMPVLLSSTARFTYKNNKHAQMYVSSLYLDDSLIYGSRSHLLNIPMKAVYIDSVTKIQIQQ
ncbi:MAG: hypothetical protein WCG87_11665 [Bacteroidota bacterium]